GKLLRPEGFVAQWKRRRLAEVAPERSRRRARSETTLAPGGLANQPLPLGRAGNDARGEQLSLRPGQGQDVPAEDNTGASAGGSQVDAQDRLVAVAGGFRATGLVGVPTRRMLVEDRKGVTGHPRLLAPAWRTDTLRRGRTAGHFLLIR